MSYDPQKHHRRSIRLPDYDYSQPGAYFITIVTRGRECLFGEIEHCEMKLNDAGKIVWDVWSSLPSRYPQIGLGTAQVMPNHFHGIVNIHQSAANPVGAIHTLTGTRESPLPDWHERRRMTLPLVVGYFKMNTAKRINKIHGSEGIPVWQRNYGACPECPSGRTEGNISSGMGQNTTGFTSISRKMQPIGARTMSIPGNIRDKVGPPCWGFM